MTGQSVHTWLFPLPPTSPPLHLSASFFPATTATTIIPMENAAINRSFHDTSSSSSSSSSCSSSSWIHPPSVSLPTGSLEHLRNLSLLPGSTSRESVKNPAHPPPTSDPRRPLQKNSEGKESEGGGGGESPTSCSISSAAELIDLGPGSSSWTQCSTNDQLTIFISNDSHPNLNNQLQQQQQQQQQQKEVEKNIQFISKTAFFCFSPPCAINYIFC